MDSETRNDDALVCPHCGFRHTDVCDLALREMGSDMECHACGQVFRAYVVKTFTYVGKTDCVVISAAGGADGDGEGSEETT